MNGNLPALCCLGVVLGAILLHPLATNSSQEDSQNVWSVDGTAISNQEKDWIMPSEIVATWWDETTRQELTQKDTIHLIVLVHGWMGTPTEMDYIQETLERQCPTSANSNNNNNNNNNSSMLLIHSAKCNNGNTHDGIVAGGTRLAREIDSIVHFVRQLPHQPQVTLSVVGNSLGGLYSRQALGEMTTLNSSVIPKLFITTATPHLGVSQHTYLGLPRVVEWILSLAMKQTGPDMFRFTPVVNDLTCSKYMDPLLAFEQRWAYANVWGTDFQVPTSTAAFLAAPESLHHPIDHGLDDHAPPSIVAQFTTVQNREALSDESDDRPPLSSEDLAQQLDHLGWTKIMVDFRSHLPSFSNWFGNPPFLSDSTVTAQKLRDTFHAKHFQTFPFGHNIMIANSQNAFQRYVTQAGKPVMDYMAFNMIEYLKP